MAEPSLKPGTVLSGTYEITRLLGQGGMGAVYEAVDSAGETVAVKTLAAHLGDDAQVRHRFALEIEALKACGADVRICSEEFG